MELVFRIRDLFLSTLALIGAFAILVLMIHIMSDVILRNTINQPVPATYEIVTNYYMTALAFVPLAWLERRRQMVTVEVIDSFLSPGALWVSNKLVALISTIIYATLAWVTWEAYLRSFASGTFVMAQNVPIPTWPAYSLPPLGFTLAALITGLRIFEDQKLSNPTDNQYTEDHS